MNIFRHELKQNRNATVAWTLALVAVAAMYISIFQTIADSPEIADIMKNFPSAFKKTFGLTEDFLTVFPGLYAVVLNLVLLAGSVQAMNLGTGITSKEVRDKTADFLLTRPVSRSSVMRQKLLSVLLLILATNAVFMVADWGLIQYFVEDPFRFRTFIVSTLSLFLVQLFFLAFGFMLGAVLPRIKSVIAVSLPVVFGFYVLGLFDTIVGREKIKFMTPFKFFDLRLLTAGQGYEKLMLLYLAALVIVALATSFVVFQRKDIHTI